MLTRIDKRGDVAGLVGLFTATIVIIMILTGFVIVHGFVKTLTGNKVGEKIYKDGEVGVGNVETYMKNYERLVRAEGFVRKGNSVDDALFSVDYRTELVFLELERHSDIGSNLMWGVFYD